MFGNQQYTFFVKTPKLWKAWSTGLLRIFNQVKIGTVLFRKTLTLVCYIHLKQDIHLYEYHSPTAQGAK